jgi:predicted aldo/keto reductase-like oxidoreductase
LQYRVNPKNNDKLSILGFGCMRLPRDEEEAYRQLRYAIDNGVNYFDTAYIYQGNEIALGKALSRTGRRDEIKIATKIPHYSIKSTEDMERIFTSQLERLQTSFIDYYLIHMLSDVKVWDRLSRLGAAAWLEEKKKCGKIKNIGFSYHGGRQDIISLLDIYDWDFCMIQYNYLDESNQAGKTGLLYASSKAVPVMVMEPLRGGKLVDSLPKEVYQIFRQANPSRTPAEWALRWIWNHKEVATALSGMNSMEMLKENIRIANDAKADEFTAEDEAMFKKVREILLKTIKVPCTGCGYCLPCPNGVDIPVCFSCLNDIAIEGGFNAFLKYLMQTTMRSEPINASRCVKCGRCEKKCPQAIPIMKSLEQAAKSLEPFFYKPAAYIIKKYMKL